MSQLLKDRLTSGNIKFSMGINPCLERYVEGEVASIGMSFHSTSQTVRDAHEIEGVLDNALENILAKLDEFVRNGSGYTVVEIESARINSAAFNALGGSSCIPTPKPRAATRGVLNVENGDEKCFLWTVLAALYPPQNHRERVKQSFPHTSKVNTKGLTYPTARMA